MLPHDDIRNRLAKLSGRRWPEHYGPRAHHEIADFYGWTHQYRLNPPLEESELSAFEERYGVTLPDDYRAYLLALGNGGAGPFYGVFPLGTDENGPVKETILHNLRNRFAHDGPWHGLAKTIEAECDPSDDDEGTYIDEGLMAGAMPLTTAGCHQDYWLVISGPARGQVWFDNRANGAGIRPVTNGDGSLASFATWYLEWLNQAEKNRSRFLVWLCPMHYCPLCSAPITLLDLLARRSLKVRKCRVCRGDYIEGGSTRAVAALSAAGAVATSIHAGARFPQWSIWPVLLCGGAVALMTILLSRPRTSNVLLLKILLAILTAPSVAMLVWTFMSAFDLS